MADLREGGDCHEDADNENHCALSVFIAFLLA